MRLNVATTGTPTGTRECNDIYGVYSVVYNIWYEIDTSTCTFTSTCLLTSIHDKNVGGYSSILDNGIVC